MNVEISRRERISKREASALGALHRDAISDGFLTTLGLPFLSVLYRALSRDRRVHLIVAEVDGVEVGFACTSIDLSATYRRFILRFGPMAAVAAARHMFRPSALRRALETVRASRVGRSTEARPEQPDHLPVLMNLCVDGAHQRAGIGREMLATTSRWLEAHGLKEFVAVTGEDQSSAVAFYRRLGAIDEGPTTVHADASSRRFRVSTGSLPS